MKNTKSDVSPGFYWAKLENSKLDSWNLIIRVNGVYPFYKIVGWDTTLDTRLESIDPARTPIIIGNKIPEMEK